MFVVSALLYFIAPAVIVRHIFRRSVVDGQTVLGAIAAYLLLGMMFSFAFLAISAIQVTPRSSARKAREPRASTSSSAS